MIKFNSLFFNSPERLRQTIIYVIIFLSAVGLFFLSYAYISEVARDPNINIFLGIAVQIFAFGLGALLMLFIEAKIPTRLYTRFIMLIGGTSIFLMALLATPLGIEGNNATRWIDLSFFQFQPSEFMKIACIIFFAYLFSNRNILGDIKKFVIYTVAILSFIAITSALQPDFGTALILIFTIFLMALVAKPKFKWWLTMSLLSAIFVSFALTQSYVTTRITTFYDIYSGNLTAELRYGAAYHSLENLDAVRVGGTYGQGSGYVAQNLGLNIPEVTTDSIFALIAAEVGFVGSVFIILTFLFFLFLCFSVAFTAKNRFEKYLAVGISALFGTQFFVNILVVLGLPATGIPLIFFSKGGSSILFTFISIGILLSILKNSRKGRVKNIDSFLNTP